MMRARITLATVCLAAVVGCGSALRTLSAPPSDYADYRATRVLPTVGERLGAAMRYMQRHPTGVFFDEVDHWFRKVEPLYFEASSDSGEGMQAYLAALPEGPHAASASERVQAFRAAAQELERLAARGAALERRLALAAQERENVTTTYASWMGTWIDFESWGRPLDEASDEFKAKWMAEPKPRCTESRCSKVFSQSYVLRVRGVPEEFVSVLEVSVRLVAGKVSAVSIGGPDLFNRLAEAHFAAPVQRSGRSRARALEWAVEVTGGAIERRVPADRCLRVADSPTLMVRSCDGFRVDVIADAGEEDQVVIRGPSRL
ncbi:MAG TPA: hypothetical protein VJT73_07630 [Polyangiaceae bacterium]|nr:hypothetical protein [Polyangiaceae bacterium]